MSDSLSSARNELDHPWSQAPDGEPGECAVCAWNHTASASGSLSSAAIPFGPYRCPTSNLSSTIAGCGSYNTAASFEARVLVADCLDCGIWFEPAIEYGVKLSPTHHPRIHAGSRW